MNSKSTPGGAQVEAGVTKVTMPAGRYWVGDPCYTVPNERWMEWLEAANFEHETIMIADLDGHPVLGIGTAYGDGVFRDQVGNRYPVDAGMLGVVPVDLVGEVGIRTDLVRLVEFEGPFLCRRRGTRVVLGDIEIETD